MLSNQIIQNCIEELRNITKVELAVYDLEGNKIVRTSREAEVEAELIRIFADSIADTQELDNKRFMKIQDEGRDIYILTAAGDLQNSYSVAKIAVVQLQALLVAYKEKYDRNN